MKTEQALLVTAFLAFTATPFTLAHAQGCSGGPDGGADATGNQCSVSTPAATEIDPAIWTMISSHMAPRRTLATETTETATSTAPASVLRPVAVPLPLGPGGGDIQSSQWTAH